MHHHQHRYQADAHAHQARCWWHRSGWGFHIDGDRTKPEFGYYECDFRCRHRVRPGQLCDVREWTRRIYRKRLGWRLRCRRVANDGGGGCLFVHHHQQCEADTNTDEGRDRRGRYACRLHFDSDRTKPEFGYYECDIRCPHRVRPGQLRDVREWTIRVRSWRLGWRLRYRRVANDGRGPDVRVHDRQCA